MTQEQETPAAETEPAVEPTAPEAEEPTAAADVPAAAAETAAAQEAAPVAPEEVAPVAETAAPPVDEAAQVAVEEPAPAAEQAAPAATEEAIAEPAESPNGAAAPAPVPAPARAKRPPRPREPLPWPELRAAATAAADGMDIEDLKELFRLLPNEVRDETIDGVREYRKGARRPVSAHAGKSLARAIHTARRARRRPESDNDVSAAIGQALAAEIVASLDVEIAAEVILPKRDLLDRQSRDARRKARDDEDKSRDEKRRRAREEAATSGDQTFGTYSGSKIRGLDELKKLMEQGEQ